MKHDIPGYSHSFPASDLGSAVSKEAPVSFKVGNGVSRPHLGPQGCSLLLDWLLFLGLLGGQRWDGAI